MLKMKKICKRELLIKIKNLKGIWFHIVGIACLFWFLIRVIPAPHRSQYPCQQISIPIALGYIAWVFWVDKKSEIKNFSNFAGNFNRFHHYFHCYRNGICR